jgi:hypothetical protein
MFEANRLPLVLAARGSNIKKHRHALFFVAEPKVN